jgi:hypothetical protein
MDPEPGTENTPQTPTDQKAAEAGAPNTSFNKEAQSAQLGVATILFVIWAAFVAVVVGVGFFVVYFFPVVITGVGLVLSNIWRHNWLDARAQFDQTDAPATRKFVNNVNTYEDISNLFVFVLAFMINIWNYVVTLLWFLIQLFYNIAIMVWKFILPPAMQPYILPVVIGMAQIVSTISGEVSQASYVNSSEAGVGVYVVAPPCVNCSSTMIGNMSTTEFATRGFQTYMSFQPFFAAGNVSEFGELVNFLSAPVLENMPYLFKFAADSAALTRVGGSWTRVIAEDVMSKQAMALLTSSNCFAARALRTALCATQTWLAESLSKVAQLDGMSIASPTCAVPDIVCSIPSGAYSNQTGRPWDANAFIESLFGDGGCSADECDFFVVDVYTTFAAQPNATCAHWVDDPAAVYNCMLRVQSYIEVNSTSRAQASPGTLGAEICLVALAQNVQSCQAYGVPFKWDPAPQAYGICASSQLNASYATCSCPYRAPLCVDGCCATYARHVDRQVLAQVGGLTCAEIAAYFPTRGTFCPLIGDAVVNRTDATRRFQDNTYQSMFCQYALSVVEPLCASAPSFTRLRDLDTEASYAAFASTACAATVNQTGVCIPINATVDSLAFDIISYAITNPTDSVYDTNDAETYYNGEYLVTDFAVGDDAETIFTKTREKHACEQLSQIYKNDNALYTSRWWSPIGAATKYCDWAVVAAAGDVSIANTAFYKYQSGYGQPIPVVLAGLPPDVSAFGESVNPNAQIGGVCTGQVGPNVNELQSQDMCLEAIRTLVYNLAGQSTVDATAVLEVFVAQDNFTSHFYTASGLVPISPDDPEYARRMLELDRTVSTTGHNWEWSVIPWEDIRDATPPFRTEFDSAPPDTSPYSHYPAYPVYTGSNTDGAQTDSTSSSSAFYGPAGARRILNVGSGVPPSPRPAPQGGEGKEGKEGEGGEQPVRLDIWQRAYEAQFRRRMERMSEQWRAEMEEKKATEEGKDPFYWTNRRLKMTGQPTIDARVAEVMRGMASVPHHAPGVSDLEYREFLVKDTAAMFSQTSRFVMTRFFPKVYAAFSELLSVSYPLNVTDLIRRRVFLPSSLYETAGTASSNSLEGTVYNPFRYCGEFSSSYTCCYGLTGCIKFNADQFYNERTTVENVKRWDCNEVDYFIGWNKWFFKAITSVLVSFYRRNFDKGMPYDTFPGTLIIPYADLPQNFFNCLGTNAYYGFIDLVLVIGGYYFVSLGLLGLVAIIFSNARQQQEDVELVEQRTDRLAEQAIANGEPAALRRQALMATAYAQPRTVN